LRNFYTQPAFSRAVKKLRQCVKPFTQNSGTQRTDGRTDRHRQNCYINIARRCADARQKRRCRHFKMFIHHIVIVRNKNENKINDICTFSRTVHTTTVVVIIIIIIVVMISMTGCVFERASASVSDTAPHDNNPTLEETSLCR